MSFLVVEQSQREFEALQQVAEDLVAREFFDGLQCFSEAVDFEGFPEPHVRFFVPERPEGQRVVWVLLSQSVPSFYL